MKADLPSTFTGSPQSSSNPLVGQGFLRARLSAFGPAIVAVVLALGLTFGDVALAQADELTDQLNKVNGQISQAKLAMDQANAKLTAANAKLTDSKAKLAAAQAALAKAETNLSDAKARDKAAADALKAAQDALVAAKEAVTAGEENLAEQQRLVGVMAREQYQHSSPLLDLAVVVAGETPAEMSERLQWVTTMNEAAQAQIDRLQDAQRQLNAARDRQAQIEATVQAAKDAAAKQVAATLALESEAETKKSQVSALVATNAANQKAAADLVAAEKKRLAELEAEQKAVQARIAARIAALKKGGYSGVLVGGFLRPVSGSVTSVYGMRFHPVLHIWKLHDGQDYGSSCGSPIKAAAAGVVSERYYNAGYGNRLMIDHGYKNGIFITTGYNHASSYIVSVGAKVTQGQTIGYVGSTGYSTGCHLHLMVWENGVAVNPAKYFGAS